MKFLLFTSIIVLLFYSCASRQKTATPPQDLPLWVQKTPADQQFYYGVGAATKSKGLMHRDVAKRHALRILSESISVQISSTSLLQQYATDDDYRTFFVDHIRLNTFNELSDYELVEEWEDRNQYWVLYRLCRTRFAELKQQRMQNAFNQSVGHLAEAQRLHANNRTADAIRSQILALESIKNYLNEDFNFQGQKTQESYSASLISMLNVIVEAIKIEFDVETHEIELASEYENEGLTFRVVDRSGVPQSGIPVTVFFSYSPGRIEKLTSDAAGIVRFTNGKVLSRAEPQQIAAQFNFATLVRSITFDPIIRAVLVNRDFPRFYLPVNITPARVGVTLDNRITGQGGMFSHQLTGLVSQALTQAGFVAQTTSENTDFHVVIKTELPEAITKSNQLFTARLKISITALNRINEKVFYHTSDDITGVGKSSEEALNDAHMALQGKIRLVAMPMLIRELQ